MHRDVAVGTCRFCACQKSIVLLDPRYRPIARTVRPLYRVPRYVMRRHSVSGQGVYLRKHSERALEHGPDLLAALRAVPRIDPELAGTTTIFIKRLERLEKGNSAGGSASTRRKVRRCSVGRDGGAQPFCWWSVCCGGGGGTAVTWATITARSYPPMS